MNGINPTRPLPPDELRTAFERVIDGEAPEMRADRGSGAGRRRGD
jgi:hypothetical protein